ncbi:hypothetical protein AADZ86_07715 [Colwelliaceae bacterium BS250]
MAYIQEDNKETSKDDLISKQDEINSKDTGLFSSLNSVNLFTGVIDFIKCILK